MHSISQLGLRYQLTEEVEAIIDEKNKESGVENASNISGDDYSNVHPACM